MSRDQGERQQGPGLPRVHAEPGMGSAGQTAEARRDAVSRLSRPAAHVGLTGNRCSRAERYTCVLGIAGVALLACLCGTVQASVSGRAAGLLRAKLSSCLVGRWTETGEHDSIDFNHSKVALSGGAGRTLTFSVSGKEVVSYSKAQPLTGALHGTPVRIVESGVITYHVATHGNRLTFKSQNLSDSKVSGTYGGAAIKFGASSLPPPETFACTASTLTERSSGYSGSFTRS